MDLMSSRLKSFGFGKRNKHHSHPVVAPPPQLPPPQLSSPTASPDASVSSGQASTHTLVAAPASTTSPSSPPSGHSSSSTSLPMNNPNQLGRPPSYTYNTAARPTSPMPPGHHPPPLNTNMPYAPPGATHMGAPPGYGMQPPAPHGMAPGMPQAQQYPMRNPAVEVEGAGRSKAQLIVGIDFGTTFSGVAFAFATNNEAREDIITEWPGAGTHTKQKVGFVGFTLLPPPSPLTLSPPLPGSSPPEIKIPRVRQYPADRFVDPHRPLL